MISYFEKDIVQKELFFASLKYKGQCICKPPKEVPYSTHFLGVVLNAINFTAG